jgi:hypothetical protein
MQLVWDQYCFKKTEFQSEEIPNQDPDGLAEENKKLLCNFCKNHITDIGEAISINGAQSHTFKNPAGFIYTVSCYRTAPGCSIQGEPTNEFSWFSGYVWQVATCRSCKEQLGWLFSNEQQFYALITDRLTQQL